MDICILYPPKVTLRSHAKFDDTERFSCSLLHLVDMLLTVEDGLWIL